MMPKPIISQSIPLKDAPKDIIWWVETQLSEAGLLDKSQVNGVYGDSLGKAFAEFKEAAYLASPELVGQSSIDLLESVEAKHPVSEQTLNVPTKINPNGGSRTGKSIALPRVGTVFENEFIVSGVPLLWGEMTKGLTRIPVDSRYGTAIEIIDNIIKFAKVFGLIRDKFGSSIGVNSGYRDPATNKRIGGASQSQHLFGKAGDLRPLNGDFKKLLEVVKSVPEARGVGLGMKKGFLHVDIRSGKRVIFPY